ncbi:hypothetical protein E2C01_012478 [Portunus trituberculatus]|uniref:Uncharacterized protein n=1 Tax=Portunus trituberculatus TaxID=210409 RepID=A0A5B7DDU7_PORTR|nr:hypothetical protein [Portunus trituberculatus]
MTGVRWQDWVAGEEVAERCGVTKVEVRLREDLAGLDIRYANAWSSCISHSRHTETPRQLCKNCHIYDLWWKAHSHLIRRSLCGHPTLSHKAQQEENDELTPTTTDLKMQHTITVHVNTRHKSNCSVVKT